MTQRMLASRAMIGVLALLAAPVAEAQTCAYGPPECCVNPQPWYVNAYVKPPVEVPDGMDLQLLALSPSTAVWVPGASPRALGAPLSAPSPVTLGHPAEVVAEPRVTSLDVAPSRAGHDVVAYTLAGEPAVFWDTAEGFGQRSIPAIADPSDVALDPDGYGVLVWADDGGIVGCRDLETCRTPEVIAAPEPGSRFGAPRAWTDGADVHVVFHDEIHGQVWYVRAFVDLPHPVAAGAHPDIHGDLIVYEAPADDGCTFGAGHRQIHYIDQSTGAQGRLLDRTVWGNSTSRRPRVTASYVTYQADFYGVPKRALMVLNRVDVGTSKSPHEVTDDLSDTFWFTAPTVQTPGPDPWACSLYRSSAVSGLQDGDGLVTCFQY